MEKDPNNSSNTSTSFIANFRRSSRNRESNDDLSNLESELRRAYMAKELETQLLEQQTERYIQKIREQRASKQQQITEQTVHEENLLEKLSNRQKSSDYRAELVCQIQKKEEEKKILKEEAREEREILREVDRIREHVDKMRAEETKTEVKELINKQNLILEEMKEIRLQEEEEADARKLKEDELHVKKVEERMSRLKQLIKEKNERKEKVAVEIGRILMCDEIEKREREILMIELMTEDLKRELMIREEEEKVKRRRMKEELAKELEEQIVFTEECKIRFVEQDKEFAEEVLKRIMEDERIEMLTDQAKKRMQAKYRDELMRLIETRRVIRQREMRKMKEEEKEEVKREEERTQRVQDERKRLLEQHVKNISEYLDRRALTREEMRILNETE